MRVKVEYLSAAETDPHARHGTNGILHLDSDSSPPFYKSLSEQTGLQQGKEQGRGEGCHFSQEKETTLTTQQAQNGSTGLALTQRLQLK